MNERLKLSTRNMEPSRSQLKISVGLLKPIKQNRVKTHEEVGRIRLLAWSEKIRNFAVVASVFIFSSKL